MWYDPKAIANILSLRQVRNHYHITYDSTNRKFVVTKPSGKQFAFLESEGGLLYLDTTSPQAKQQDLQQHVFAVNTVRDNKKYITNNDYLRAVRARELQVMIGRPSDKDLIKILKTSSLPNCPVTPRDVIIANKVFGPDVGALKGKTTRQGPPIVDSPVSVDTTSIFEHYGEITFCVDLMYVNKVPLLVTLSHNIKFGTMEAVADWKEATLLKCIKGVITSYQKAGFRVTIALIDGEFIPLCRSLAELGIRLNETSRDEHVGDIEWYIRMVKEQMRAIYNTLPFQEIPAQLVIEMAKTAVFWLNAFPAAGGASHDLSPCTILTGQQVDYKRHCCFQFGEYTQTHEEHNNSMNPRTVGAIALRLVGNGQGSFYFPSITTGRVLNQLHATALPMPDNVIDKLHKMARQQKSNPGLIFADRNLNPEEYDDDDDDEAYHDNSESEDEDDLSHNDEEDSDVDDDEMVAPGPPEAGDEVVPDNSVGDDEDDDIESEDGEDEEIEPAVMENDGNGNEDQAEEEQPPGGARGGYRSHGSRPE